jgi:hypothetical protein
MTDDNNNTSDGDAQDGDQDSIGDRAAAVGDRLGQLGAWGVILPIGLAGRTTHSFVKSFAGAATTIMPFMTGPTKGMAKWALQRMHKSAGGDAIGLIHEPDGTIEPVPVKFKSQSVDEDGVERAGWHALDRDRSWHEGADGREVDRIGRTPVVLLDSASTQRATATEARFAECLDLDQVDELVQLQNDGQVDISVQMGGAGAGDAGTALPDGGAAWEATEAAVEGAVWEASLVDIGADDHDGMRINPRKVKQTYREQVGSEQLDEVERLGFLAGLVDEEDRTGFVIKVLLITLGIIAAITIGPGVFSSAAGGMSGGGSLVPFVLGLI